MGLAPLKALIDQVARKGPARRVDLFVGFRTEDQIYDRADLQRLEQENPWLTVTYAVSEDKVSVPGARRRSVTWSCATARGSAGRSASRGRP